MDIIVAPRGAGKTTQLIKKCAEYKYALIICHNKHLCEWTFSLAEKLGFAIPMPITYDDLMRGTYRGKSIDAFLLDNVDLFLRSLTAVPIAAITLTQEVEGYDDKTSYPPPG